MKDGNTSYAQEYIHNMANWEKPGIMNTNYHNMPNCLTNTGISTGTMKTLSAMVGKKLNSSQDACLKEGVMLRFIHFLAYSAIPGQPDHLPIYQTDKPTMFTPYLFTTA